MSEQLLTILKLCLLALLYLFFLRVLRAVWAELKPHAVDGRGGQAVAAPVRPGRPRPSEAAGARPPACGSSSPRPSGGALPAGRRAHRRPGRRLPGHARRHLRVTAPRPRLHTGRAGLRRGPRLHQRHLPEPAEGRRARWPCNGATASRSATRSWSSHSDSRSRGARPPTSAACAPTTRTPRSSPRTSSPSPTAWAATRRRGRQPGRGRRPPGQLRRPHRRRPRAAVEEANRAVFDQQAGDPDLQGMGTTLVAIARVERRRHDELAFVNVGDCRIYLLRDGELDAAHRRPQPRGRARARGPAHRRGGRGPPPAQHRHPGPRHRRRRRCRRRRGRARSTATASCSAATASSTRSTTTASPASCAGSPTPTRRPPSWCASPTRAAAGTTSPSSWSTWSTTTTAPPRRRPRSAATPAAPAATTTSPGSRRPRTTVRTAKTATATDDEAAESKTTKPPRPQRFTWRVARLPPRVRGRARRRRRRHRLRTPAAPTTWASTTTRSPSSRASPAACSGSTRRSRSAPASPAPTSRPRSAPASTAGHEESSLADAREFVENLREQAQRHDHDHHHHHDDAAHDHHRAHHRDPDHGRARRDQLRPAQHRARPHPPGRRSSPAAPTRSPASAAPHRSPPTSARSSASSSACWSAAHLATRRLAPGADGILLPLAALLNGIGYVFIARLDEDLAGLQATWTAVGVVAYVATLVVVRRIRDLERYRYTFMLVGIGLLLLPLVPGVGRDDQRRPHLGQPRRRSTSSRASSPRSSSPSSSPSTSSRSASCSAWRRGRRSGPVAARPQAPRAGAAGVGRLARGHDRREGPRLVAAVLRPVHRAALGGHRADRVPRPSAACCSPAARSFAYQPFDHVQDRVDIWLDPWQDPDGDGFQVVQSWFALAWGGVAGTGLGLGNPDRIPVAETDFIFAAIGEELGLLGATADHRRLPAHGRRRPAHRRSGPTRPFEKLLATGLTDPPRRAGVHHHGGRHPAPAAHRRHPAVRLLRRLVAARQLRAARPARAHLATTPRRGAARSPTATRRAVNRQIRRLGVGLLACYLALFAQLNYVQVVRADELNDDPRNTRDIVRDFDRAARPDRHRRRRRARPRRSPRRRRPLRVPARVPRGRPVRPHHRVLQLHLRRRPASSRRYNDELAGPDRRAASCADLVRPVRRPRPTSATSPSRIRERRPAASPATRSATQRGLGRRPRPPRRRRSSPCGASRPTTPTCCRRPRHRGRQRRQGRSSRPTPDQPAAGPHATRSAFFPGLDVQGGHRRRSASRPAWSRPTSPSYPAEPSYDAAPTDHAHLATSAAAPAAATLFDDPAGVVQHRLRPDGRRDHRRPTAWSPGAEAFGFNDRPPIDLPAAADVGASRPTSDGQRCRSLAQSAIGQNDVQATPLQMALVAGGVANDGVIMAPHVLAEVRDDDGEVVEPYEPEPWTQADQPADAPPPMREAMVGVVERRHRHRGCRSPGVEVGGKTGTAQLGTDPPPVARLDHRLRRPARAAPDGRRRRHRRGPAGRQRGDRRPGRGAHRPAR